MTTVQIKIVYIQELEVVMMEGEATEGVAFIIPTSIAPRYSKSQPASEITSDRLDIKIMVLNDGKVKHDGCQEESGHTVYYGGTQVMEPPQIADGNGEQPLREYYCWNHHSDQPTLSKDFVFVIQMHKGLEIQSQAICCPADDGGLAAMMVSIRPNDLFRNAIVPQSFSGEILFLLDQSGSMNWTASNNHWSTDSSLFHGEASAPRKIDILRKAMLLVISGLPKTCPFNIVSWGSETWAMWEHSRESSPDNIEEAKTYISQIQANFGGTDLLRALKSTVERRRGDSSSTQIVVLTDGELDPHGPIEFVWKTRQALQNKIRFFALGIGCNVPHSLIESIADLGGGFGDIVDTVQNPRWHNRLNRLFKSSLEPDSWDCTIDIGQEFEQHGLMESRLDTYNADSQRTPYFQAPHTTTTLHPFKFTTIFFLLNVKDRGVLPSEVTITTTTHGAKMKTYRLPVKQAMGRDGTMHRLAAKAALVDLEDLVKRNPSSSALVNENAQTIGTRYSITSKWTSFVAVSQSEPNTTTEGSMMEYYKAMYDGVSFNELLTTADSDSDQDEVADLDSYAYRRLKEVGCFCLGSSLQPYPSSEEFVLTDKARAGRMYKESILLAEVPPSRYLELAAHSSAFECTSREASARSPSPTSIDPLNWEVAVEYQNGQGLFELSESAKGLLHLHFCPNTELLVVEKLEGLLHCQRQDQGASKAVLGDTIMTIICYHTHLALEEDIWDLMMEKARDAVTEAIGQDVLKILEEFLTASMMHNHFTAVTGGNGNEDGGRTDTATCPVCNIRWQGSRTFFCPFDHEPGTRQVFEEWADFWEHQKENGHMVCPREPAGA